MNKLFVFLGFFLIQLTACAVSTGIDFEEAAEMVSAAQEPGAALPNTVSLVLPLQPEPFAMLGLLMGPDSPWVLTNGQFIAAHQIMGLGKSQLDIVRPDRRESHMVETTPASRISLLNVKRGAISISNDSRNVSDIGLIRLPRNAKHYFKELKEVEFSSGIPGDGQVLKRDRMVTALEEEEIDSFFVSENLGSWEIEEDSGNIIFSVRLIPRNMWATLRSRLRPSHADRLSRLDIRTLYEQDTMATSTGLGSPVYIEEGDKIKCFGVMGRSFANLALVVAGLDSNNPVTLPADRLEQYRKHHPQFTAVSEHPAFDLARTIAPRDLIKYFIAYSKVERVDMESNGEWLSSAMKRN